MRDAAPASAGLFSIMRFAKIGSRGPIWLRPTIHVTFRLYASRAPFEHKEVLKAAGYRWSPKRRAWWIEGNPERIANQAVWLAQFSGQIQPQTNEVTWISRYNDRMAATRVNHRRAQRTGGRPVWPRQYMPLLESR